VRTSGDGVLAEFASVVNAVQSAVELQRGMAERNVGIPQEKRIEFRIGINVGDIIVERGDIWGDGVNVAARLEALAERGGICVAGWMKEDVESKHSFVFEDAGEQRLKNIARPVRVYRVRLDEVERRQDKPSIDPEDVSPRSGQSHAVGLETPHVSQSAAARRHWPTRKVLSGFLLVLGAATVGAWWWRPHRAVPCRSKTQRTSLQHRHDFDAFGADKIRPILSIVVLPFLNLSADKRQDYFSDGITDSLTTISCGHRRAACRFARYCVRTRARSPDVRDRPRAECTLCASRQRTSRRRSRSSECPTH
jgi:hypothetical protein